MRIESKCAIGRAACGISVIILAALFVLASPSSLGIASSSLLNAHAFPVPFMPSKGDTAIVFTDLSASATIRIYSAGGQLIQTLQESDGDGVHSWDARAGTGEDLASGIYIYSIVSPTDEKTGKLVIVR